MVQKCGNGLKMGHTSTYVVIKHTWLRMFIGLIEIAMEHGGMSEEDATHFIEKL